MLINFKNVHKVYTVGEMEEHILKGVSFEVEKGEFIAIIGPSGSGKSTLMHILGLLDLPSSGHYKLDNQDISQFNENELALLRNQKIGFVFQSFYLLTRTTLLENVKLPLIYSTAQKNKINDSSMIERARIALERVGLGHRINHFSNQISGGEKQRVAIARALINNPSVILADEPTGNLDSKSGEQVMKIFKELNNQGNTIILVTHDSHIANHANRTIKVMDGKIVSDKRNRLK